MDEISSWVNFEFISDIQSLHLQLILLSFSLYSQLITNLEQVFICYWFFSTFTTICWGESLHFSIASYCLILQVTRITSCTTSVVKILLVAIFPLRKNSWFHYLYWKPFYLCTDLFFTELEGVTGNRRTVTLNYFRWGKIIESKKHRLTAKCGKTGHININYKQKQKRIIRNKST